MKARFTLPSKQANSHGCVVDMEVFQLGLPYDKPVVYWFIFQVSQRSNDSLFKTTYWIMILDAIHIKTALNVGTIGNDIAILGQPASYHLR